MSSFVGIKNQYFNYRDEISRSLSNVLEKGNFILGEEVALLEQRLADYIHVKHCIATSSGTDSLQIALMALGISQGDEVITVPFTWISTASSIVLVGAKPVFVDIDPCSYLIDVSQIESKITSKTKAIIPVSLFGQMPDFDAIMEIAGRYNLTVIEDGAQSFGATRKGAFSCSHVHVGITSFFPTKPLSCFGDGGALFTNDDCLAKKMRAIRNHGSLERDNHIYIGMTGRLDTLQAAILLVKLNHFNKEIALRNEVAQQYTRALSPFCLTPVILNNNTHVFAQYTIRIQKRNSVINHLITKNVPCRVYYPRCIHEQESFRYLGYKLGDFPQAEKASQEVLSLPLHPWLTHSEIEFIVHEVMQGLTYE